MRCPHGTDVGDPPHAVNCDTVPCRCLADCLFYEDQSTTAAERARRWSVWRWWADVRGDP
jgi:hypothetical protein